MPDTGTGADPTTDRCPDCGHPADSECPCSCCRPWAALTRTEQAIAEYERIATLLGWAE